MVRLEKMNARVAGDGRLELGERLRVRPGGRGS